MKEVERKAFSRDLAMAKLRTKIFGCSSLGAWPWRALVCRQVSGAPAHEKTVRMRALLRQAEAVFCSSEVKLYKLTGPRWLGAWGCRPRRLPAGALHGTVYRAQVPARGGRRAARGCASNPYSACMANLMETTGLIRIAGHVCLVGGLAAG
ncbi:hypothetical protein GWK47_030253 [Chionoecetes opilio]|uniref:Uncharacterized protein n=1 Tax=Chionoecetes opilio TaxID=41210 RepID=A0A8J5D5A1_CHIOP|nr:hypothetical protein GWK47_030253 [Chionoecetes opilio]